MLYDAYEIRRTATDLWSQVIDLQVKPLRALPGAAGRVRTVRSILAATDVARALQLTHDRPDFGVSWTAADGEVVEVPEQVIARTDFASLLRFWRPTEGTDVRPKVLVVPGLAGHFATLVSATVETLVEDHDVYVVDWRNARDVPVAAGRFGLEEYIEHLMDFLREIGPGTHLMAICQPAVACLAAASIMSEDADPAAPASLILLAGPVDTRVNPGKVNKYAQRQTPRTLEQTVIHRVPARFQGAGRKVYPGFVQVGGFMGMDPRRHLRAFGDLYRDECNGNVEAAERTRTFYREYFAVLDVAAEFYLETVKQVFMDNDLPRGELTWRGRKVDPGQVSSALFTIEGELDEMCPPGQTQAAHALCTAVPDSRKRHLTQSGVGHYGVFSGSTFKSEIYPQIREFVQVAEDAATVPA